MRPLNLLVVPSIEDVRNEMKSLGASSISFTGHFSYDCTAVPPPTKKYMQEEGCPVSPELPELEGG